MPNERISMSKLKQLIGLRSSNLSVRVLAPRPGPLGRSGLRAVKAEGIEPAEAQTLSETDLDQRVFGTGQPSKAPKVVPPDCAWITQTSSATGA